MEIYLDKRALRQIRLSSSDAVSEEDYETLREDITEAFSDEQIEEIERRIDNADCHDFLGEILEEWSGEDADELFELLEAQLAEAGIDLKYPAYDGDDEDDVDDEGDVDDDDEASLEDEFDVEDQSDEL